jgi:hypothetical protein
MNNTTNTQKIKKLLRRITRKNANTYNHITTKSGGNNEVTSMTTKSDVKNADVTSEDEMSKVLIKYIYTCETDETVEKALNNDDFYKENVIIETALNNDDVYKKNVVNVRDIKKEIALIFDSIKKCEPKLRCRFLKMAGLFSDELTPCITPEEREKLINVNFHPGKLIDKNFQIDLKMKNIYQEAILSVLMPIKGEFKPSIEKTLKHWYKNSFLIYVALDFIINLVRITGTNIITMYSWRHYFLFDFIKKTLFNNEGNNKYVKNTPNNITVDGKEYTVTPTGDLIFEVKNKYTLSTAIFTDNSGNKCEATPVGNLGIFGNNLTGSLELPCSGNISQYTLSEAIFTDISGNKYQAIQVGDCDTNGDNLTCSIALQPLITP